MATWPEPNGSGRRGSAATGSGATMSRFETCTGNLVLVGCLFYRKLLNFENVPRLYSSHVIGAVAVRREAKTPAFISGF
eukprot:scaffold58992_cov93-Phaeocystis_antarctica.AAC.1